MNRTHTTIAPNSSAGEDVTGYVQHYQDPEYYTGIVCDELREDEIRLMKSPPAEEEEQRDKTMTNSSNRTVTIILPDGKKVRQYKKDNEDLSPVPLTFQGRGKKGDLYMRADGKKVRLVKRKEKRSGKGIYDSDSEDEDEDSDSFANESSSVETLTETETETEVTETECCWTESPKQQQQQKTVIQSLALAWETKAGQDLPQETTTEGQARFQNQALKWSRDQLQKVEDMPVLNTDTAPAPRNGRERSDPPEMVSTGREENDHPVRRGQPRVQNQALKWSRDQLQKVDMPVSTTATAPVPRNGRVMVSKGQENEDQFVKSDRKSPVLAEPVISAPNQSSEGVKGKRKKKNMLQHQFFFHHSAVKPAEQHDWQKSREEEKEEAEKERIVKECWQDERVTTQTDEQRRISFEAAMSRFANSNRMPQETRDEQEKRKTVAAQSRFVNTNRMAKETEHAQVKQTEVEETKVKPAELNPHTEPDVPEETTETKPAKQEEARERPQQEERESKPVTECEPVEQHEEIQERGEKGDNDATELNGKGGTDTPEETISPDTQEETTEAPDETKEITGASQEKVQERGLKEEKEKPAKQQEEVQERCQTLDNKSMELNGRTEPDTPEETKEIKPMSQEEVQERGQKEETESKLLVQQCDKKVLPPSTRVARKQRMEAAPQEEFVQERQQIRHSSNKKVPPSTRMARKQRLQAASAHEATAFPAFRRANTDEEINNRKNDNDDGDKVEIQQKVSPSVERMKRKSEELMAKADEMKRITDFANKLGKVKAERFRAVAGTARHPTQRPTRRSGTPKRRTSCNV